MLMTRCLRLSSSSRPTALSVRKTYVPCRVSRRTAWYVSIHASIPSRVASSARGGLSSAPITDDPDRNAVTKSIDIRPSPSALSRNLPAGVSVSRYAIFRGGTMQRTLAFVVTGALLGAVAVTSASQAERPSDSLERPFVSKGRIRMDLGAGEYRIAGMPDSRIRMEWSVKQPEYLSK